MINVGVIGLGGISRKLHIPQAIETGKFYIKAAADVIPDDSIAKSMNIPDYYTDYRQMLADPDIDAVIIASPHDCHEEHAVAAFEAGKHVLIEKPISRNLKEAKNILDAAKKAGKIGMLGFCQRYEKKNAYINEVIKNPKFGKLLSARVDHYQDFRVADTHWWRNAEKVGGGAVIGSGVHRLDLLRWYFGEAVSVYAKAVNVPARMEAETCVHAVIQFESGVIANFSINWAAPAFFYEGLSISGETGFVTTGIANKIYLGSQGKWEEYDVPDCQSMYDHFAECIETGKKPLTDMEEGYKSLQLVRAIYKSIETGSPVDPKTVTF